MRYLSEHINWALFGLGLMLLIVLGFSADRVTSRLVTSKEWVSHTHEVLAAIDQVRSDVLAAESARFRYVFVGASEGLAQCRDVMKQLPRDLERLEKLTVDNSEQQQRIQELRPVIDRRVGLIAESLALRESGQTDAERQKSITVAGGEAMDHVARVLSAMDKEEENLLLTREVVAQSTYSEARLVLIAAFAVALTLLLVTFREVVLQLRDRRRAEEAVRRLSGRLLQLQDAERRKVARELHDGIGQYFAGLGMTLDSLKQADLPAAKREKLLADCAAMVQQGAAETRTLSHLLHPPLLDEAGFASAAKWYVEGYRQRSQIDVALEIPSSLRRMPKDIELALFRVLQEGLTNIHRHSGSKSATVRISYGSGQVSLVLQDFGKGISEATLEEFRKTSTGSGIGLAGMKERIAELGGSLDIESGERGTTVLVRVPLPSLAASGDTRSGRAAEQEAEKPERKADGSDATRPLSRAVFSA
jgi:signal transduction histidine kinase